MRGVGRHEMVRLSGESEYDPKPYLHPLSKIRLSEFELLLQARFEQTSKSRQGGSRSMRFKMCWSRHPNFVLVRCKLGGDMPARFVVHLYRYQFCGRSLALGPLRIPLFKDSVVETRRIQLWADQEGVAVTRVARHT